MKIVESILTRNPCYIAGKKITVKGLMLHSVGCNQPNASAFIKTWNPPSNGREVCVHAFVDGNTGTVHQTLPWNHRGWHGGGSSNNTHIGVEMCEPACIKYTSGSSFTCSDKTTAKAVAKRTYDASVELFAMLCKKYNLNPTASGVIVSHKEGYAKGIASNHGDPEHLWKGLGLSYTMASFRKAVKAAMTEPASSETTKQTSVSYKVKVSIKDLNIRKGPGTNYSKWGFCTGVGVFTIVKESTGQGAKKWGLLKSYEGKKNGWISLDYTKRV